MNGPDRVIIAGYLRSPFQPAHKGELARVRPDELGGQVVRALVERSGVDPADARGRDGRLRVPRGGAGHEHGTDHRHARRAAPVGRRRHGQPVLRIVDAGGPHGCRRNRGRYGRGVRRGRSRVDVAGADGRLQLPAPPGTGRELPADLHVDGRDGRERGGAIRRLAEPPGGVRSREPAEGGRRRRALGDSPTRSRRSGRTAPSSSRTAALAPARPRRCLPA